MNSTYFLFLRIGNKSFPIAIGVTSPLSEGGYGVLKMFYNFIRSIMVTYNCPLTIISYNLFELSRKMMSAI